MNNDFEPLKHFPSLNRLMLGQRRRHVPIRRQLAATDCGPAALAMVLAYFGKQVSLDELRGAIGLSRDGTSAASLLRCGRTYGLRGRGVRVEEIGSIPTGAILYWEFHHFVVFDRMRGDKVDVVDPANGRRSISVQKFRRAFTGVALIFEPNESFEPGQSKQRKLSGLLGQILRQKDLVFRVVTSSLLIQILSAVVPLFTAVVIDRVVPEKDYSLLLVLTIGYCLFQIANLFLGFVRAHLLIYLRTKVEAQFTLRFLDHLVDLSYKFFQLHTAGDLMVRLGSNNAVREILTSTTLSAMVDGVTAASYLIILLVVDVQLTIVVLLLAIVRFVLLSVIRWRQKQLAVAALDNQARSQTFQVEMLHGMESLKAMGIEHRAAETWSHLFVDGLNISIKQGRLEAGFNALLSLLGTVTTLVFLFYGTFLVLKGSLSLGMMMAFSALASGFLTPLNNLVNAMLQIQMVEVYIERLNDVLDTPKERTGESVSLSMPLRGAIALEDVAFRYSEQGSQVLERITISVEAGARIAIVGRTGCGKSTLARLMAGLYDPSVGRILFDGRDLRSLDLSTVRSQLGIVTQETQLFGGSIRKNIALTDPQMPFEQVVRAARIAEIHEEIMAMPIGYDTPLIDRGLSLSGGQRQRLALARALARAPKILVLDEATSNLDSSTEERITQNLALLHCTQVIIAHRLSTVRNADVILVMDSGKIVESGTHQTLVSRNGMYAALISAQREEDYVWQAR